MCIRRNYKCTKQVDYISITNYCKDWFSKHSDQWDTGASEFKPNSATVNANPVTQRPLRQARLKAAEKISNSKVSAGIKNEVAKRSSIANRSPNTTEVSQSPIDKNSIECVRASEDGAMKTTSLLQTAENQPKSSQETDIKRPEQGEWQQVAHKRTRKLRQLTVGVGKEDHELQTVEKIKYIQAWSFKPGTTVENVRNFLNKIVTSDDYIVEKRNILTKRHASFIIGILESLLQRVKSPTSWPLRVMISDWFLARPRKQRGEEHEQLGERNRRHKRHRSLHH